MKELVLKQVNRIFNCDILDSRRKQDNVYGRIAFATYLRSIRKITVVEIAEFLKKSHPNVCHYIRTHNDCYKYNTDYRKKYNILVNIKPHKRKICRRTVFEFRKIRNFKDFVQ